MNQEIKKYEKILRELVAIKSISADPSLKGEILKCVSKLEFLFKKLGFHVEILKGKDNPVILAETPNQKGLETILVYGHYDVQPAEDNFFSLTKKSGRYFGRGTADNKGQVLLNILGVAKLLREKRLGYNVKFLIEGNEETGSPNLKKLIEQNKKKLECDCILISDGELEKGDRPALEASFRGVANVTLTLVTAPDEFHSGLFGGAVPNAALELSKLLSKLNSLKDKSNKSLGLKSAIEITSITSGYQGTGFQNSIPGKAVAKINLRSTPTQNPAELVKELKKLISENTPKFAKAKLEFTESCMGATLDLNNKFSKRAEKILGEVYSQKPAAKHSGGTLPIVNDFKQILKVPQVMVPLANEDCGMHSASENITLKAVERGLKFSSRFFSKN